MSQAMQSIVIYALMVGLIIGGFAFYKNHGRAELEVGDRSMSKTYEPGSYSLDCSIVRCASLKTGDCVSYWLSNAPRTARVARVVALEGERVRFESGALHVNGVQSPFAVDRRDFTVPEIRVPRGCVFLLADISSAGVDSVQIGPVPMAQIIGRLK